MRLDEIQVERFRNFIDPQTMAVEPNVTCLVGKNESGKTTILKALHRLNPANAKDDFDVTTEYPRRRLARDRRTQDLTAAEPITARFSPEPGDVAALTSTLGFEPPNGMQVVATRSYAGALSVDVVASFGAVLAAACTDAGVDDIDRDPLSAAEGMDAVIAAAKELAKTLADSGEQARSKAVAKLPASLKQYAVLYNGSLSDEQTETLTALLPKFFYFSDYELLPGECDMTELATRVESGARKRGDETLLALLALAGQEPKNLLDEEYTSRQAELQAAGSDLSDQVFKYWKQNDALKVMLNTDMPIVATQPDGHEIRHRFLKVELHDARHDVNTNFETRSSGFQWFFSFLAAFSVYRDRAERVVVLLDEPGMSLHGEAQKDFLSYIVDELGRTQQVLYTTHSQHMLDPSRYETMRAIHDRATREQPELGVVITPVNLSADRTTILPVEAALGYSVSQHLFLGSGPHLAVEGSSDFIFLTRLSEHLISLGRRGLDPKLSIIPVGGAGNMPAFIAIMGRRLDVRALIDGAESAATSKKVAAAAKAAGISLDKIVVLGQLDGLPPTADVEDLFTTKDYLWLYNRGVEPITEADLPATPEPILRRLSQAGHANFDLAKPAHRLTAGRDEFFAQVDTETLNRFEQLLERLIV